MNSNGLLEVVLVDGEIRSVNFRLEKTDEDWKKVSSQQPQLTAEELAALQALCARLEQAVG